MLTSFLTLLGRTLVFRSYVFLFLAIALYVAGRLMGAVRTVLFFSITWLVAFACEFSSTRTGIPFGWYFYNGSTRGQELYISNVPFMDSLSFTFLLFVSYCLSIVCVAPREGRWPKLHLTYEPALRTSPQVLGLAVLFFVLIDVVIDPIALRGDLWFLGKIYYYPTPGLHFGVPLANYMGWAVVGLIALGLFQQIDRRLSQPASAIHGIDNDKGCLLVLGCALYYAVLCFNLTVTFWVGESMIGWSGVLLFLPITIFLGLKLAGHYTRRGTLSTLG